MSSWQITSIPFLTDIISDAKKIIHRACRKSHYNLSGALQALIMKLSCCSYVVNSSYSLKGKVHSTDCLQKKDGMVLNYLSNSASFTTDGEIIKQIKGTNQELAEIKELLKQQVNHD